MFAYLRATVGPGAQALSQAGATWAARRWSLLPSVSLALAILIAPKARGNGAEGCRVRRRWRATLASRGRW